MRDIVYDKGDFLIFINEFGVSISTKSINEQEEVRRNAGRHANDKRNAREGDRVVIPWRVWNDARSVIDKKDVG
jgi:hypothetical protein